MSLILQSCFFDQTECQCPTNDSIVLCVSYKNKGLWQNVLNSCIMIYAWPDTKFYLVFTKHFSSSHPSENFPVSYRSWPLVRSSCFFSSIVEFLAAVLGKKPKNVDILRQTTIAIMFLQHRFANMITMIMSLCRRHQLSPIPFFLHVLSPCGIISACFNVMKAVFQYHVYLLFLINIIFILFN